MNRIKRTHIILPKKGRNKGRRIIQIHYLNGTVETKNYARYVMEQHLGRKLTKDEVVDHIDNCKSNDSLENLQVITRAENDHKRSRRSFGLLAKKTRFKKW